MAMCVRMRNINSTMHVDYFFLRREGVHDNMTTMQQESAAENIYL